MMHIARTLALSASLLGAAAPAAALDIAGASTIQPILEALHAPIEQRSGEAVHIQAGGSGAGIRSVLEGRAAVGMVSRALTAEERARLQYTTIGFDALAIIVHRDNPLSALDRSQVADLFSGRIDNWQAIGGPDLKVVRVTKEVGRSTLDLFEGYSGLRSPDRQGEAGAVLISRQSYSIGANVEALTLVGGIRGAVGYVSLGSAQGLIDAGMPVKILTLDGVPANAETLAQRRYPIVRELNLVHHEPDVPVRALLDLLLGSEGQAAVKSFGFLPVHP